MKRRFDKNIGFSLVDADTWAGTEDWVNAASNIEQVLEAAPHKAAAVRLPTTHHENYQS